MLDMASSRESIASARKIKLGQIALPTEHGSWGFLLEPLVAALVIAISSGGIWISVMVIGAFLARRPLQVIINQRNVPAGEMKAAASKFLAVFSLFAAIGLVGALLTLSLAVLIPLATALPVAVFQLYIESTTRGRQLAAELAGAFVMPASAASIILAGGGGWPFAAAVWFLFAARFVPSILYIRNRLNLEKGKPSSMMLPASLHGVAFIAITMLAMAGHLPMLVIPAFALLFARSIYGLSRYRKRVKAMKIGVSEIVYGLILVVSFTVGYVFSI